MTKFDLQKTVETLNSNIAQLQTQLDKQTQLLQMQMEQINSLLDQVAELNTQLLQKDEEIARLKEQLNKNSKNSSKPPSSDGYKKPSPKSTREKTGKKQGGQPGHQGVNLAQRTPDRIVGCMPSKCSKCPHHDECVKNAEVLERRQVIDAVVKVEVVEYDRCRVKNCPLHGWTREGDFPVGVNGVIQYGENLQALVVSLNTVGAVSIARTHEILSSVFDIPLSCGTISSMVSNCAGNLKGVIAKIGERLTESQVDNADETGVRVDKKLHWVHVLCNKSYTLLKLHAKRGWKGMEDIGYILHFHGILVHDCWASYWKHPGKITHAVCCAHLLRELSGIEENYPKYTWPTAFKKLLLEMKAVRDRQFAKGLESLSYYYQHKFGLMYDEIIKTAYEETPLPEPKPGKKKGRQKRGKVLSLIDRLKEYKGAVCLFIKDFVVPFDNNQAERDLRMTKAKSKISGCFRTFDGAQEYLDVMSYASTAKKLGHNAYWAIKNAISGNPDAIFA